MPISEKSEPLFQSADIDTSAGPLSRNHRGKGLMETIRVNQVEGVPRLRSLTKRQRIRRSQPPSPCGTAGLNRLHYPHIDPQDPQDIGQPSRNQRLPDAGIGPGNKQACGSGVLHLSVTVTMESRTMRTILTMYLCELEIGRASCRERV